MRSAASSPRRSPSRVLAPHQAAQEPAAQEPAVRGAGLLNLAAGAALGGALVPLLLLAWSDVGALVFALVVFGVLLVGPVLLDRRLVDVGRADRLAAAWVRGEPDPEQVTLLTSGPGEVVDPGRAWSALARAGLLRSRSLHSRFGSATSPANELRTVYGGALLGSGFGLVSVAAVVVIDAFRTHSTTLAALSVVAAMVVFAGVEYLARWAAIRAGQHLAWLDLDDPRTLAGRRALLLLASTRDPGRCAG